MDRICIYILVGMMGFEAVAGSHHGLFLRLDHLPEPDHQVVTMDTGAEFISGVARGFQVPADRWQRAGESPALPVLILNM